MVRGIGVALLVLIAGCAPRARVMSFDEAAQAVEHSDSFRRLMDIGVERIVVLDDGSDADYFNLWLGDDRETHVCRCATLRVSRRRGTVERLEYDGEGEEAWISDTQRTCGS